MEGPAANRFFNDRYLLVFMGIFTFLVSPPHKGPGGFGIPVNGHVKFGRLIGVGE
jgi:hypothetical protein